MSRTLAGVLTLLLLFTGGPGWSALLCACGERPEPVCCCCDEHDAGGAAAPTLEARCPKVDVGREASVAAAGAVEPPPLPAPTLVPLPPALTPEPADALAGATAAAALIVPHPPDAPTYLRSSSLRC